MSHVQATPQAMTDAAGNLSAIGSTINTANATAAPGTAAVKAPGGDEVSAYITALFAAHAQNYQAAGAQAASYHDQFVQALRAGAGSYANTETANASPLEKAGGMAGAPGQTSAGHPIGNGANGAMGTGQHGSVGGPSNGNEGTNGPGNGNLVGGGPGTPAPAGAPGPAAIGGPPGGHAAGGGANGVPAGDGGGSGGGGGGAPSGGGAGGATSGGGGSTSGGGGGGPGEVADHGGAGGGAGSAGGAGARDAAGAGVPTALGPAVPLAPIAPLVPGLTTGLGAPAVMAGDYPATAGLAGLGGAAVSGGSPAIGGLAEPAAPVASPAAGSPVAAAPAAEPALGTATKAQSVHPGNPARAGDTVHPGDPAHPADTHHDKPAVPLPLPLLSLRGLRRKLQQRSGLRDIRDWRKELSEAPVSKPWGRDELLGALGLRPPGSEMTDRVGGVSAPGPPTPRSE